MSAGERRRLDHDAQRQFELGEANFRGQHFDEAADNFKAAAAGWPDSALAQDALFAYAESLFFAESYPKANNAYEDLLRKYPNSKLEASGTAVGLPAGQMGNSEVGHMNLGAGRVVYQELGRIHKAVDDNEFPTNPVIKEAFEYAKQNNKDVHFIGLVSDGGVHSHIRHLEGLCDAAGQFNHIGHGAAIGIQLPFTGTLPCRVLNFSSVKRRASGPTTIMPPGICLL